MRLLALAVGTSIVALTLAIGALGGTLESAAVRIAAPADCLADSFCRALERVYGIRLDAALVPLAGGDTGFGALAAADAELAAVRSAEPELTGGGLQVLEDDRGMLGRDAVVPLARSASAETYGPRLARRLDEISQNLRTSDLTALADLVATGSGPRAAALVWLEQTELARPGTKRRGPRIVVAAQSFRESLLLAHVYAEGLRSGGFRARVVRLAGNRPAAVDALASHRADLIVEYVGSMLAYVDGGRGFSSSSLSVGTDLLRGFLAERDLVAFRPARAVSTTVLAATPATAAALGLERLSDLRGVGLPVVGATPPVDPVEAGGTRSGPRGVLRVGSLGRSVAAVQRKLRKLGFDPGPENGVFGGRTRAAVIAFQRSRGLPATGVVNKRTKAALDRPRPTGKVVYLTFDDGPHPAYTPRVLSALARYDARATFFLLGRSAAAYPALARRVVRAGHSVGNHTYDHPSLVGRSVEFLASQVGRTTKAIRTATGATTTCLRPPYGAVDAGVRAFARTAGLRIVLWTVDPNDWQRPGSATIAARVLGAVRPGSVVLLHDGGGDRSGTVAALETILATLRARGYSFAALACS